MESTDTIVIAKLNKLANPPPPPPLPAPLSIPSNVFEAW